MNCDLHTHTVHSDGSDTPKRLIELAKERELVIALTDHNTVTGLPEFLSEAERQGVTAIGGTEMSTEWEGREFHLIGLFIAPEYYDRLENLCRDFLRLKEESNIRLVNKLAEAGYPLDFAEVKKRNIKGQVNRAHIAAEMVKLGYVSTTKEAFDRFLDEKIGLYQPPKRFLLTDAIKFLKEIGAVSVLAHPLKEIGEAQLRAMLPTMVDAGLVGIETMHSSYDEEMVAVSKSIAADFGLLESGGSDYHGEMKFGVTFGIGGGNKPVDGIYYEKLLEYKNNH